MNRLYLVFLITLNVATTSFAGTSTRKIINAIENTQAFITHCNTLDAVTVNTPRHLFSVSDESTDSPTILTVYPLEYLLSLKGANCLMVSQDHYEQMVTHLLELGANPTLSHIKQRNPLLLSATQKNFKIFKKLLDHTRAQDSIRPNILLEMFRLMANPKKTPDTLAIVQELVNRGIDVQAQDKDQKTVIFPDYLSMDVDVYFYLVSKSHEQDVRYVMNIFNEQIEHDTCNNRRNIKYFKILYLHRVLSENQLYQNQYKDSETGKTFLNLILQSIDGHTETLRTFIKEKDPKLVDDFNAFFRSLSYQSHPDLNIPKFLINEIDDILPQPNQATQASMHHESKPESIL
ncbi:hypothetical protein KBD08_00845 [Candidatus Babeliales bacterium]|nr:hypothetical protein [Candidatus Babeliales bacterium]